MSSDPRPPRAFTSTEAYRWQLAHRYLAEARGVSINSLEDADRTTLWVSVLAALDDALKLSADVSARRCHPRGGESNAQAS